MTFVAALFVAALQVPRPGGGDPLAERTVAELSTPEARWAWLEAWRLIAGLPPTTTHFFCVYD
jgi:hypothetical protein